MFQAVHSMDNAGASAIGVAISENLSSGTGVVEALIK